MLTSDSLFRRTERSLALMERSQTLGEQAMRCLDRAEFRLKLAQTQLDQTQAYIIHIKRLRDEGDTQAPGL